MVSFLVVDENSQSPLNWYQIVQNADVTSGVLIRFMTLVLLERWQHFLYNIDTVKHTHNEVPGTGNFASF